MNRDQIEDIYPLSPMQQGMLFHSLYAPESEVYVEQMSCTLKGRLNISAFEQAWRLVLDRHPALRTAFMWEELEEPMQIVYRQLDLPLQRLDWRSLSAKKQRIQFEEFLRSERSLGFDLAEAPLMRLALIHIEDDTFYFIWTHHHLLLDGWSLPIILGEVFSSYEAFSKGTNVPFGSTRPYRDYIAWLQQQNMAEAEQFWRKELAGFSVPTPLVVERSRKEVESLKEGYAKDQILFSEEESNALRAVARQHQLTLNTLFQGAWALVLAAYSGEEDILFGATVSGRPAQVDGADSMVGLFINTLPVRVKVPPEARLIPWLKELQGRQGELRQYEYSPLVQIQGWSQVPRELPLFESILVFENYPVGESLAQQGQSLKISDVRSFEKTNYPLTVVAAPGRQIMLQIAYDVPRFEPDAIQRMLHHLRSALRAALEDSDQRLSQIQILSNEERQRLLVEWNGTDAKLPQNQCVHHLFAAQAEKSADTIAAIFESEQLTYRQLNQKANQLAHYLMKSGIEPDAPVGLCLERSSDVLVGMLGILKAGGCYVPLDPSYPSERLAFMLEDSGASILLTQEHLISDFRNPQSEIRNLTMIRLDSDWPTIAQESEDDPLASVSPDNLAYIIYTSGTTGRPKGTMVSHKSLVNHALAFSKLIHLTPDDRLLQFISLSFDASGEEIYPTLLSGSTLVFHPAPTEMSGDDVAKFCEQHRISILHLPVAFWHQWMDELFSNEQPLPSALRQLVVGGEAPSLEKVQTWVKHKRVHFLNAYGPTEATITTTAFEVFTADEQLQKYASLPIGRPIANVQVYLLDRHLKPVPIGVPGELHIGGVGLARGYLNHPEMTAEKFIPNPFSTTPGARLYRTGDLARYLPDGNIEFLGRIDQQVKIRGFRIELGEIESVMRTHPAVSEAIVLAREDDNEAKAKRLVAYLLLKSEIDQAPTIGEWHDFLQQKLPDYMVPSAFMVLDSFPLAATGKIDRKALPAPDQSRNMLEKAYVAPRTQVEELLADLCAQVLGVEKVGIYDNFFELGGHSLLATQLLSRIRETFKVELPLRSVFESPTVVELVRKIETAKMAEKGIEAPPIEVVPRDGELQLSFAQQRLWFLDQLAPSSSFYNIPMALRLKGRLNVPVLEKSINELLRRHESLRTRFITVDGKPLQVIEPDLRLAIDPIDLSGFNEEERETMIRQQAKEEAQRPFDLSQSPLLRIILLQLREDDHVILLTMHHIISDGWSVAVLIKEMTALYEAFSRDKPSPLPDLKIQYADFAQWQRNWLQGEVLDAQLAYWREQLKDCPPLLELPTDHPRPAVQSFQGASQSVVLPQSLADALIKLSREENSTLFMTLLAAFQVLLYRYTGQLDLSVGTPIANRNRLETESLIGFFVNTLVLRSQIAPEKDFRQLLAQVRDECLGAFAHQDVPFEMLVEALQPQRDLSHSPLFQVMFVLQNAPMQRIELEGLTLSPLLTDNVSAKFDLTLVVEEAQGLHVALEYNTDLFEASTILRMLAHFQNLLEGIVSNPELPISQLPIITLSEKQEMLVDWNKTEIDFPNDKCVHECFEALVEQNPDALAVTFGEQQLSYLELNRRANQLAHQLQKLGVVPETLVGICIERSVEMAVAIMGTLKAGAAFVPLDPTYPAERLAYMVEDSGVPVLLSQEHLISDFGLWISDGGRSQGAGYKLQVASDKSQVASDNLQSAMRKPKVVCLDSDWESIAAESDENLTAGARPENLAYVIYTSGSTGRPKGTMLQHRGLCNLAQAQRRAFHVGLGSRILQFSSLSFDASVWETVMALLNGAALCLTNRDMLVTGQGLLEVMREQAITTVTLPPSVLAVMPEEALPNLKTIVTAGEKCTNDLVQRWADNRFFFNAYGPTETTVCASMHLCDKGSAANPPIGRPIDNTELFILDAHLNPVPIGVAGELHIGGVSLARGYLHRPDLTAEKFIPNPFSDKPGARLYKTGDSVRYLPDGNIEFLGRIDHQVKVRGFRIELGEIEAVLVEHPAVRDAAVLAREEVPGDTRLVGYVVVDGTADITVGELRNYLRSRLPDYMVPAVFVRLDAMPLSPSGKVDRKALPAPDQSRPDLESVYVGPRDETEAKLAEICAALLNLEKVGVYDNFFDLGGHSLLATQFMSRLRDSFQVDLPLRSLFEKPTIAELAEVIKEAREKSPKLQAPTIAPIAREGRRVKLASLKVESTSGN